MKIILSYVRNFQFTDKRVIIAIWVIVALWAALKHATRGVFNDYLIFKYMFYHTLEQVNLYLEYPALHNDTNHYGPIFSLIFAPFALLPDSIGTIFWDILMSGVVFIAIYKLPIVWRAKAIILYLCLQPMYVNAVNSETNGLIVALIIGSFLCIRSEKEFWAACFIALGLFIKLYGIVGLAFFFFSKHKLKFIGYILLWSVVFFVLPMLISSPQFIVQCYVDWYDSLVEKNMLNLHSMNQDISVMGMARRISGKPEISNLVVLIPGLIVFACQYIKINYYNDLRYQLGLLSSTLLFVVLFSTGSESCTYIIAMTGASIWFILQPRPYNKYVVTLIVVLLLITVMSSGIAPHFIRKGIIRQYALLAFPYFVVWLTIIYQMLVLGKKPEKSLSDNRLKID